MRSRTRSDPEAARLSEIRALNLGALRPKIDRLSRLARTIAQAPHAYAVIVDKDHGWMSGFEGHPEGEVSRDLSIASMITTAGRTLWTHDAGFIARHHPWVAGPPYARSFCGAPIRLANGVIVGAFCVLDTRPRDYAPDVIEQLEAIADLLADEIERMRAERNRAAAESEVAASQRLLKSFVQAAPVALAMTDRQFRFLEVSPRWRSEQGVRGRVLGRTVAEVFPEGFEKWGHVWRMALAGEPISGDCVEVPCPDGRTRWMRVELTPWRNSRGEIGGVVAMTSDITEMVASLERAEHSEKRLKLAIEIANFMFYEVDGRTGTMSVGGAEDTFLDRELTYEEMATDPWIAVHPEDRPAAIALWQERMKTGEPFRTEYRMNRADGKEVWAYAAAEVIHGPDGKPERLLGVLKDITARRKGEQDIIAARDAAEAANRAKSEFLANMSHEIRTPLNGIVGVAQALGRTPLSGQQEEMVGLIQTSSVALETILSDVLDFSRIESGRLELRLEKFELAGCLRSAATLFQASAQEKGLAFAVDVEPTVNGVFEGDAGRIRQIMFNLLSNAVKFTRKGEIAVRAGHCPDGRVQISVSDTGIGFDEATRTRIFERFEQADGSITREYGGSGLGLAISRALAQAMGGQLEAISEPGHGSTFTLTLPLVPVAQGERRPPQIQDTPELSHTPRVLLAEDHAVNRRVIELLLDAAGVNLTCVENGREAVEATAASRFDLILMDMQMPEMDGLTAIRAIREQERREGRPPAPIWGLSANALPEHTAASLKAGADGHLTKPISAPALFQVLAEACAAGPEPDRLALSA